MFIQHSLVDTKMIDHLSMKGNIVKLNRFTSLND